MKRKGEGKMTKDAAVRGKVEVQVVPDKEEVLAVLKRAANESEFLARLADDPHEALKEYYSLTSEERAALASGDIKKIESWVGKLDKELATWLWCRLSQEKY
jgi:bifunctional DNA-binding transcriptional regulator/antitoxin component of YhaV-PrlF toxin-antitoxin module